jgi:hypothetical protein
VCGEQSFATRLLHPVPRRLELHSGVVDNPHAGYLVGALDAAQRTNLRCLQLLVHDGQHAQHTAQYGRTTRRLSERVDAVNTTRAEPADRRSCAALAPRNTAGWALACFRPLVAVVPGASALGHQHFQNNHVGDGASLSRARGWERLTVSG